MTLEFEYLLRVPTEHGTIELGFYQGGSHLWVGRAENSHDTVFYTVLRNSGLIEKIPQKPQIYAKNTMEKSPDEDVSVGSNTRTLGEIAEDLYINSLENGPVVRLKGPIDMLLSWVQLKSLSSTSPVGILTGFGALIVVGYLRGRGVAGDHNSPGTLRKYAMAAHDDLQLSELPEAYRFG